MPTGGDRIVQSSLLTSFSVGAPWLSLTLACSGGYALAWLGAGLATQVQRVRDAGRARRLAVAAQQDDTAAQMLEALQIPVWREAGDGRPTYRNAAFRAEMPDDTVPVGKAMMTTAKDGVRRHFALSRIPLGDGAALGCALPADVEARAEQRQAGLAATFTAVFANLPIGLAVFDADQRLELFNPALLEHLRLDPAWLAKKPSLNDVLLKLREIQRVPEPRDFRAWRQSLTQLQPGARDLTYDAEWQMPDGQVFRVGGRAHPKGGIAFTFEDITVEHGLRAKHFEELHLSQAIIDCAPVEIAGYGPSGDFRFSNEAFDRHWQAGSGSSLVTPDLAEMHRRWRKEFPATEAWHRLSATLTNVDARKRWREQLRHADGSCWELRVAPLPNSGILMILAKTGPAPSLAAVRA